MIYQNNLILKDFLLEFVIFLQPFISHDNDSLNSMFPRKENYKRQ